MGQRYSVHNYATDGGFTLGGAALLVLVTFASAIALGTAASFVGRWLYLILVFPILIGVIIGCVAHGVIDRGHIRNVVIAGAAGFLAGCTAMLAMHYADYMHFETELDEVRNQWDPAALAVVDHFDEIKSNLNQQPADVRELVADLEKEPKVLSLMQARTFPRYIDFMAQQGVSIGRPGADKRRDENRGMNLGYIGSYIYWIAEVLIVAGISYWIAAGAARRPYCAQCSKWKTTHVLGGLQLPAKSAIDALRQGDLSLLAQNQPTSGAAAIAVSAAKCSECENESTVDVKLESVAVNNKGEVKKTEIAHVTFPPNSFDELARLFARFPDAEALPEAPNLPNAEAPNE